MDPCETPQAALINSTEIIEYQDLLSFKKANSSQRSKAQLLSAGEDRSKVEGFISRCGSELALKHLCERFGGSLFDKLPKLWDCLTEFLKPSSLQGYLPMGEATDSVKDPQALINNIQVVCSISPMVNEALKPKLLNLLPCIFEGVRHHHAAVRLAASRCIASMARSMTSSVMGAIIGEPMMMRCTRCHECMAH